LSPIETGSGTSRLGPGLVSATHVSLQHRGRQITARSSWHGQSSSSDAHSYDHNDHRRLGDGAAVYRSADGSWTKDLAAAAVVTTAPARL